MSDVAKEAPERHLEDEIPVQLWESVQALAKHHRASPLRVLGKAIEANGRMILADCHRVLAQEQYDVAQRAESQAKSARAIADGLLAKREEVINPRRRDG